MRASELRQLSIDELKVKEREAREELFRLRLKAATNQLNNTAALRAARVNLARILTVINEKKRALEGESRKSGTRKER